MLAERLKETRGRTPADRLREMARAYRAFARAHPGLHAAFLPAPRPGDDAELEAALAAPVQQVGQCLYELGVPAKDLIAAVRTFRSFLFGFVTLEKEKGFGLPVEIEASFELGARTLIGGFAKR
jgi:hypothetical protein